jgi:hypothetical protein
MEYYSLFENFKKREFRVMCFGLFFLLLIGHSENAIAQVSILNVNVTTDKSNIFFQNQVSLKKLSIENNWIGLQATNSTEYRTYTFFRMGSQVPYNVNLDGISKNGINFTINTPNLTDTKMDVSGSKINTVLLNGVSYPEKLSWNGLVNSIDSGASQFISIFYSNTIPNTEPSYTFDNDLTEITIDSSGSALSTILIPDTVPDPKINYSPILVSNPDDTKSVTINTMLTITKQSSLGEFVVELPSAITITGPSAWNGILDLPNIKPTSTVNLEQGKQTTSVIEIGQNNEILTFDKPVRILFEGKAGQGVGFSNGITNTIITKFCNSDNEISVTSLLAGAGECTITNGIDLVVWTYHFTTYFTFTSSQFSGGSSNDNTPPTLASNDQSFLINNEKIFFDNSQQITNVLEVGKSNSFTIKLDDDSGPQNIQHVELYLNHQGKLIKNDLSETGIIYDKFSKLQILDPQNLIQDALVNISEEQSDAVVTFDVVFSDEIKKSDILFRVWDVNRNPIDFYAHEVLSVIKTNAQEPKPIISHSQEPQIPSDLVKTKSQSLISSDIFDKWAGYSEVGISDREFLSNIGIDGNFIPKWIKQNDAKWVKQGLISQEDLIKALNNLDSRGII